MIGYLRVKSPWSQLGIFLGLLGAAFFFTSLLMAVVMMANGVALVSMQNLDWTQPKILGLMKLIQAISSLLMFLLPAILFGLIVFRKRPMRYLGLQKAANPRMYGLAILVIIIAFPAVFWLGEFNEALPLPQWMTKMESQMAEQMQAFLKAKSALDVVNNVVLMAVLPAICEELCFRGALQRIIINICRNPWTGIIVTSIIFSALHFQFQGFLPRMFLGILLGALYWYSGSLWTSIIAHFVNNAAQVIAVSNAPSFVTKNPSMPFIFAVISTIIIIVIIWLYRSLSTITYAKVYETESLNEFNQFIA